MLHIVLVLLKIIGIILASILGLLIFLILMVLFVPVRYCLQADNLKELRAKGRISWLFRLIYIQVFYLESQLVVRLRIFGRTVYDSGNPPEKKQKRKNKAHNRIQKPLKKSGIKSGASKEKNSEARKKPQSEKTAVTDQKTAGLNQEGSVKTLQPAREPNHSNTLSELKAAEIADSNDKKQPPVINQAGHTLNSVKDFDYDFSDEKKKGIFSRIKRVFLKIREFFCSLRKWFHNILDGAENLKGKIQDIGKKWEVIKTFIKNEENKSAFSKSFAAIKRILRHIRPTRLKIELEFGTGDPYTTGQILGVLAVLYAFYGNSMQVIPNFEEEIIKGSVFCIGRIRLFTLLIICIRLVIDKNFKKLLKNFKGLKEDL